MRCHLSYMDFIKVDTKASLISTYLYEPPHIASRPPLERNVTCEQPLTFLSDILCKYKSSVFSATNVGDYGARNNLQTQLPTTKQIQLHENET